MLRGPVAPALNQFADNAREAANRLTKAGEGDAAASALALAHWLDVLRLNAPYATHQTLKRYYTAWQVAQILDDCYFGGAAVDALDAWLATPSSALYSSPMEDRRVALLEEVRAEIVGDPEPARVRELIERLRRG